MVDAADFRDIGTIAIQRMGRSHLDRCEGTIVEIGFDPCQSRNQTLVANGKAHAPAGHGEGFRHRGELDGAVHGTWHFQHRRGRIAVEIDLRIGKVGEDDDVVLLRKRDHVLVEIERRNHGRRIGRIVEDERNRLRDRVAHGALERWEESLIRLDRNRANDPAGHQEAEGMDRIGRVRAEDDVAGCCDRLRHVGEAFLRAEGGDNLRIRIELHVETTGIIGGLRAAQAWNALGRGIAMGAWVLDHFAKLVDDRLRGRKIGIAHAEVDDVGPTGSRARLQTVDLFEHVRRQAPDFVKLFHLQPLKPRGS